jgi:hypothetical protein
MPLERKRGVKRPSQPATKQAIKREIQLRKQAKRINEKCRESSAVYEDWLPKPRNPVIVDDYTGEGRQENTGDPNTEVQEDVEEDEDDDEESREGGLHYNDDYEELNDPTLDSEGEVRSKYKKVCCKAECCVDNSTETDGFIYDQNLISDMRRHYLHLPAGDQAKYLCERHVYRAGTDRKRGNYFLEAPDVLRNRLDHIAGTVGGRFPCPSKTPEDCQPVCTQFLRFILGLTYGQSLTTIKEYIPGIKGKHVNTRDPKKERNAKSWLHDLRKTHMVLPNQDLTVLPWLNRRAVHAAFVEELEYMDPTAKSWASEAAKRPEDDLAVEEELRLQEEGQTVESEGDPKEYRYGNPICGKKGTFPELDYIASFTFFRKIWQYDEVAKKNIIRKWIPFSKCDTCTLLKEQICNTRDQKERRRLQALHQDHVTEMTKEREMYWVTREGAYRWPHLYMSIIIDGADQSDHELPHFATRTKSSDEAYKAKVHLMGAIAHHRDTYLYTCPGHVKQGHNVTIQTLWEVITDVKKKEGKLPKNLYLQLDNTTKQNKGKSLAAFCEFLVETGVIHRVYIRYLPVGHTHEDIDQVFSRTTIRLRKHHAFSRPHLAYQLRHGFTKYGKAPLVAHWDAVANISDWLSSRTTDETGWMSYRHFRFLKKADLAGADKACMQVRDYMRDIEGDDWRGLSESQPYHKNLKVPASDLIKALKSRDIPPAQRTEPNSEWLEKRTNAIEKLARKFPAFSSKHQQDCLAMIDMEQSPDDIPFNWSPYSIENMFPDEMSDDGDKEEEEIVMEAESEHEEEMEEEEVVEMADDHYNDGEADRALKVLKSEVFVGHTWMFSSDDVSPFWVGKVVKITTEGARVQFYVPEAKKNKKNAHKENPESLDYHLTAKRYAPTNYSSKNVDKYDFVKWDEGFVVRVKMTAQNALHQQNRKEYEGWAKRAKLQIQNANPGDNSDEGDEEEL